jgi:hypothetical protein
VSRTTDFHTGAARAWTTLSVKLTPEDRALMVRITHARGQSASEVVRAWLRLEAARLTAEAAHPEVMPEAP